MTEKKPYTVEEAQRLYPGPGEYPEDEGATRSRFLATAERAALADEALRLLEALLVWADWQAKRRTPSMGEPNSGAREDARALLRKVGR